MLSNCKKYMLTNLCGLLGGTVILSMIFHYVGNDFMVLPTIILGIFFCVANTVSIYARGMFASSHSNFITSFYLIDKVVRFVASIMLIGILVYLNKDHGLLLGIVSFAYYIFAMALELLYFFAVERKSEIQNA